MSSTVSNPRVHLQEGCCIYSYGTVRHCTVRYSTVLYGTNFLNRIIEHTLLLISLLILNPSNGLTKLRNSF